MGWGGWIKWEDGMKYEGRQLELEAYEIAWKPNAVETSLTL